MSGPAEHTTRRDDLVARINRFTMTGDAAALLAPEALMVAGRLVLGLGTESVACSRHQHVADALAVASVLGWLHGARYDALGPEAGANDLKTAIRMFALVHRAFPLTVPEGIRPVVEEYARTSPGAPAHPAAFLGPLLVGEVVSTGDDALLDLAIDVLRLAADAGGGGGDDRIVALSNLSAALARRGEATDDRSDLVAAVQAGRASIAIATDHAPTRVMCLLNAAGALSASFDATGRISELSEAARLGREAISAAAGDDALRIAPLINLGLTLRRRYEATAELGDLSEAVQAGRDALACGAPGDVLRPVAMSDLSHVLLDRHAVEADPADLADAVELSSSAVAATALDDPDRPRRMTILGDALVRRHEQLGEPRDMARALEVRRDAVAASPRHADHGEMLGRLADTLFARYEQSQDSDELSESVEVARAAVAQSRDGDWLERRLSNLATMLDARYNREADPQDLLEHVALRRAAVEAARGADAHALTLMNLGVALRVLSQHTAGAANACEAVDVGRAAVAAIRAAGNQPANALCQLAAALHQLHRRSTDPTALTEALSVYRDAVSLAGGDHRIERAARIGIAGVLRNRYEATGDVERLSQAIDAWREAVAVEGGDPSESAGALSYLSMALLARFERTGSMGDLTAAAQTGRRAVAGLPSEYVAADAAMSHLGSVLIRLYERTQSAPHLFEAVQVARAAARIASPHDDRRAAIQANLASTLTHQYLHDGHLAVLSEAIDVGRSALALVPENDTAHRADILNNHAASLRTRHTRMGNRDDLTEAIECGRAAIGLMAEDDSGRARPFVHLGMALRDRFRQDGDAAALDEAVQMARLAAGSSASDQANRVMHLLQLGEILAERFAHAHDRQDLDAAIGVWREAVATPAGSPTLRGEAARAWGWLASGQGDWPSALEGFSAAIGLLPRIAWHGVDRASREEQLRRWSGIGSAAAACALALADPRRAIELLEQGRSVLWSQELQLRDERSALADVAPALYAQLDAIGNELDSNRDAGGARLGAGDLPGSSAEPREGSERRVELAERWDALLGSIRALDGLEHFLTIPAVDSLQQHIGDHPVVVVNVHPLRSDAVVMTRDAVVAVALPGLDHDEARRRADAFLVAVSDRRVGSTPRLDPASAERTIHSTLEWLWDAVAEPVLEAIDHRGPPADDRNWPRVIWCPTGVLALMPLHAAGYHDREGRRTVLDRVISSYTSSVRSLARSRRAQSSPDGRGDLRVVAVPEAAHGGLSALPGVVTEARLLGRLFPDEVVEVLVGADATRHDVMRSLAHSQGVHFACHARHRPDEPSASALYLVDEPLDVKDIAGLRLERAEFAYLSACQTALGGVDLSDEAIHLAAALQLAGYRHVIGTLWSITDHPAMAITQRVYEQMLRDCGGFDYDRSAVALHRATRSLRDEWRDEPMVWAPYMHIGP